MCPNCRAFITTNDKVCPYCDFKVGPRAIERRAPADVLGGLIPHARFTTVLILLINTGLYAAMAIHSMQSNARGGIMDLDPYTLLDFGAKYGPRIRAGDWWRLITAGFLHGGVLHILMNSWVLFDLGAEVEQIYGTSRLMVFYFISTVTGFLFSSKFGFNQSVGSSAGIFGLIGAMLAFGFTDRSSLGAAVKALYVRWLVYLMVLSFIPGVDFRAHIGGLSGGFVVGWLASTPRARLMWKESLLRGLAAVCLALTALSFAMMFWSMTGGGAGSA